MNAPSTYDYKDPTPSCYKTREHHDPLCPGGIIQGEPSLKAVVNTSDTNEGIFFEHSELVDHCNNHCKKKDECTIAYQQAIADIFLKYHKNISAI